MSNVQFPFRSAGSVLFSRVRFLRSTPPQALWRLDQIKDTESATRSERFTERLYSDVQKLFPGFAATSRFHALAAKTFKDLGQVRGLRASPLPVLPCRCGVLRPAAFVVLLQLYLPLLNIADTFCQPRAILQPRIEAAAYRNAVRWQPSPKSYLGLGKCLVKQLATVVPEDEVHVAQEANGALRTAIMLAKSQPTPPRVPSNEPDDQTVTIADCLSNLALLQDARDLSKFRALTTHRCETAHPSCFHLPFPSLTRRSCLPVPTAKP